MYSVNWVTVTKFCELSGYSEEDIQDKIDTKIWEEKSNWITAPDDGVVLISIRGFYEWVEGEKYEA